MKILFLQNIWREYFSIMHLSSVLRKHHHVTRTEIQHHPVKAAAVVDEFQPDLAGFSFTNCEQAWVLQVASLIKQKHPGLPIVAGGPHPTLFPKLVEKPQIDFLVRGEGEEACLELVEALQNRTDYANIKNLCFQHEEKGIVNPMRPLLEDLDTLPFPDRANYYRYKFLRDNPVKYFFTGRGCPGNCAFCFNKQLKDIYPNKHKYIRHYSAERAVAEIIDVKAKYPMRFVRFEDDLFTVSKRWLKGFLELYKNEVGLPYMCYIRAGVSEEVVRMLKDSNCYSVLMGVETGDEQLRNELLHKGIKDEQLFNSAELLHKHGIHFWTSNMLGLPGETFDQALKTIRINQKMKTPGTFFASFQPYAGLPITDYAIKHGYLDGTAEDTIGINTFSDSALKQKDIKRIFNLHKLSYPLVRWPWLEPVLLPLTRLPQNALFYYLFVFFYVVSFKGRTHMPWIRVFDEGLHWFRVFLFQRIAVKKPVPRKGVFRRIRLARKRKTRPMPP